MIGISEIPELKLDVLQNFVTKWMSPAQLALSYLFPESSSPSSTISWESQEGGRGMAPFVPPGAVAPQTAPYGVASHSAEAAFWKEKMYFDEEFLNNLRKAGTVMQYDDAANRLAREMAGLTSRNLRRKEWMFAKMLFTGAITYSAQSGLKISVDYQVPTANSVTLAAAAKWSTGTSRDILGDVIDAKQVVSDACGGKINVAIMTSKVLRYMASDPDIQTLLQKSTFGNGDLFSGNRNSIVGANPKVIGSLLDIDNIIIYDEKYEIRANLTANVTGSSTTTVYVDDISDFEDGMTLRFVNTLTGTWEEETISSVDVEAGTITIASAPTASFRAARDYVCVYQYYVPQDKVCFMATSVDGRPIAEFKQAPFGLDRHYGIKADRKDEWDPEGTWIRVQNKGIPILWQRDAIYILDVA